MGLEDDGVVVTGMVGVGGDVVFVVVDGLAVVVLDVDVDVDERSERVDVEILAILVFVLFSFPFFAFVTRFKDVVVGLGGISPALRSS